MIFTIVVDYDGVLELKNGEMNLPLITKLNDTDARILVWTSRDWLYYDYIQYNLDNADLEYSGIICGKPLADIYLDDKTVLLEDFMKGK